jgi:calcium-translocating P-type ATPase
MRTSLDPRTDVEAAQFHALSPDEVHEQLRTPAREGLTEQVALDRLTEYGPNELDARGGHGALRVLLRQFHNPLIYILLVAAAITLLVGKAVDSAVITAVVVINSFVGFVQEWRAGQALAALAAMHTTHATVIRDGEVRKIVARDVVPGDLAIIEAGDRVPADLRLVEANELQIDEANLTGESVPVHKHTEAVTAETTLADQVNMAFSGTLVTSGRAHGIAVATGANTEMGKIHDLIETAEGVDTPLTRKLNRFSRWLTVAILALAAVTFLVGIVRGETVSYMVVAAVALAVGAIPEGLPAVVTVTLAIGVSRMARRRAIVRRLPAVETLGSTAVICSDKTGTLTENRMTVQFFYCGGDVSDRSEISTAVRDCILAGLLCNDATVAGDVTSKEGNSGDPTELALITVAHDVTPDLVATSKTLPRTQEIPFASELRFMATLHEDVDHESALLVVKGAVEDVLELCDVSDEDSTKALQAAEDFGGQALRVLAFAWQRVDSNFSLSLGTLKETPLTFLGLQAMMDPPREEAVRAVAACYQAGIAVKMITGDHQRTAEAIAEQIGLQPSGSDSALNVLTGGQLGDLDDEQANEMIPVTDVFARVTAAQKLQIVRALQGHGLVVAMTGDGVNDAPALKQADIGVAMGLDGTEVAKETADMVLTDDNFATIEAAVEEGRGVFDNLIKFIVWTIPTNVGEGLVILTAIMLGTALPILPVQILWINMISAVALGLMLAFEPKEDNIMQRPPRTPDESIVNKSLMLRIFLVGLLMLAGAYTLFELALARGASYEVATTVAVNAFMAMKIGYLFNCRSLHHSVLTVGLWSNSWIWVGISATIALQAGFTYLPFMNTVFGSAPLPLDAWWSVIATGVAMYVLIGGVKWIESRVHTLRNDQPLSA